MPDRLIRTIDGPTGGLLTIIGIYLTGLGISWLRMPSTSREAAVEWVNRAPIIPISDLTATHIAWWWIIGGTLTLTGGILSRRHWAERTAIAAGIITPGLVSALFIGAWVDGTAPTGAISAWSYLLPAALISWQVSRERRAAEDGHLIRTGSLPTITRR
ncbi:hypothetical protein [Micrococcus lylae]|uniref:Tryptophan-rich sensory protein n=1 Tax=Micrococcus lylae TaxID=1273 RepID=A0ABY2K2P6_9MICC|nr:hypothetical protein [Micrococcus lylae]TFI01623.1 hypothetical protein E4A49_00990 [Micrococcus lylae]